ncbi:MAG: family 20 glycosylhydrolase, partial [Chloroflexi bacterium]|nr:family 20 glycosylhydrolase [Chloroflexota bacterium]
MAAAELLPSQVEQVIIAFKTHFDIGYTDMASNVVQRYRTTMIDQALQVCEQSRELSAAEPPLRIIPKPASLVPRPGSFVLNEATAICHSATPQAEETARYLAGVLRPATGFRLRLTRLKDGPLPAGAIVMVQSTPEAGPSREGYRLSVTPQNIVVSAASSAGLFYGVQTLRQLLPAAVFAASKQSGVEWTVRAAEITDQPRYPWRGSLLDVARHYLPVDFLKRYIDLLALHKMNVLQLHLTDDQGWRLEIKKYPRLTQIGSMRQESPMKGNCNEGDGMPYGPYFYTQEQMREIVAYAQARHVTIVPEIEMPGHFLAALAAHPEFSCTGGPFAVRTRWGVEPNILCAGNEAAIAFAQDVLSEVMELFPSRFIHIGGDEAPKDRWKQCAKCQARLKAEDLKDEHELQSYFVRRMDQFIAGRGRRLIGWDEILEGGLAPGATVMSWRGITGGIAAANAGHDVVMSPTSHCYFDYAQAQGPGEPEAIGGFLPLQTVYAYEPTPANLPEAKMKHILGAQGNVWGEFLWTPADVEYFAFPRVAALAEVVWTPAQAKNYDDFLGRLATHLKRLDVLGVNYRKLTPDPDHPAATAALEKDMADQPFVWTVPGWPMHKILEDWPGQTADRKQKVLRAFQDGRFAVHALPFSTHTELLELEDLVRGLGFASRLAREAGLPLPRDAKMTDVPCHSWIMPTLLRHAGVDFLHLGCNAASTSPEVPPLFWWEGPDGSRLLTMYTSESYGTGLVPPKNWPHKTWLALIHTGDNHGPPTPDEVKQLLAEAKQKLPGMKVRIGRLSDFADALLAEKPALPVVRGDMPDTWIHGPMSDPAGAKIARNTRPIIASAEALHTLLGAWNVTAPRVTSAMVKAGERSLGRPRRRAETVPAADLIAQAYEQSLLYGEHTWGGALYWITSYSSNRKFNYGDPWRSELKEGRFSRLEASWTEHTAYIEMARARIRPLLDADLRSLAQSVKVRGQRIVVFNPLPWARDGLVTVPFDKPGIAAFKAADARDVIPVDVSGQRLSFTARNIPPLGYRTFIPVTAKGVSDGSSADFQPAVSRFANPPAAATSERASRLEIGDTADKMSALQRQSHTSPPLTADATAATLESPFFKAALEPGRGVIRSLIDKRSGRELVD